MFCCVSWLMISCCIAFVVKKSGFSEAMLRVFVPGCLFIVVFLFWLNGNLFVLFFTFFCCIFVVFLVGCREGVSFFVVHLFLVDYSVCTVTWCGLLVFLLFANLISGFLVVLF